MNKKILIELVVSVVMLPLTVILGIMIWRHSASTNTAQPSAEPVVVPIEQAENKRDFEDDLNTRPSELQTHVNNNRIENWKTYQNKKHGLEFKYPSEGWTLSENDNCKYWGIDCVAIDHILSEEKFVDMSIVVGFDVKSAQQNLKSFLKTHPQKPEIVTIAGSKGFKVIAGSILTNMVFLEKDSSHSIIISSEFSDDSDNPETCPYSKCVRILNEILGTLKFIN